MKLNICEKCIGMRYDVVIIGGGLAAMTAGVILRRSGKSCIAVAEGLSLHDTPRKDFISSGGLVLAGDSVVGGVFGNGKLEAVRTRNLENTLLEADYFILATGKFFSRGLVSTMDSVFEPIFGADVIYDEDSSKWCSPDFYAPQPFEKFGVATDGEGRVMIGGRPVSNLYAAGEILAGEIDIVNSAEEVCRRII